MMINVISKAVKIQNEERFIFLDKYYKNM